MSGSVKDHQPPAAGPSIVGRAVLAIGLTVVFYTFAIAVAVALIGVPVARVATGHGFPIFIGLAMVFAGITILFSIVPRREPFVAPGPEITRADQPELFEVVEGVAGTVGHPMPDAVYLTPEVNAAVAEVGRPLGAKRRILIIGLPVLELLSVDQLRAVMAHEFGHYVGGDTRIGRWVYRTRIAIVRTIDALEGDEDDDPGWVHAIVRAPFAGYARLFMRITAAVSRRQEFAADALAVQVAGRDAHVGALRRIAAGAPAFDAYWYDELVPVLDRGRRPPVGEGFRRFLSADVIDRQVQEVLGATLEEDRHDPYDSHPTLAQRLEAVGAGPHEDPPQAGEPASSLLRARDACEERLFAALAGPEAAAELEPVSWEDAGQTWLESYRGLVARYGTVLGARTLGDAGDLARDHHDLAIALRREDEEIPGDTEARALAFHLIGAASVLALVRRGFAFEAPPGEPIRCVRDGQALNPFDALAPIADGDDDADPGAWRRRMTDAGVADEALVERVAAQA